jgi:hypothetical protein
MTRSNIPQPKETLGQLQALRSLRTIEIRIPINWTCLDFRENAPPPGSRCYNRVYEVIENENFDELCLTDLYHVDDLLENTVFSFNHKTAEEVVTDLFEKWMEMCPSSPLEEVTACFSLDDQSEQWAITVRRTSFDGIRGNYVVEKKEL